MDMDTPVSMSESPIQGVAPRTKRYQGRVGSASLGVAPGAPNPVNGAVKQGPMAAKKRAVRRKGY